MEDQNSMLLPHKPTIQEQVEQKLATATASTPPKQEGHPFPPPRSSSGNQLGILKWIMILLIFFVVLGIGLTTMFMANFVSKTSKQIMQTKQTR